MARSAIDVDEWVTRHPIAFIMLIAGIFAPLTFIFHVEWFNPPPRLEPYEWAWYAVEGTQEFVVDKADLIPPIERDGKRLVKAHFYGCDDCDAANRFLGYFEKYSDEAKAEMERLMQSVPAGGVMEEDDEQRIYELAMTERYWSTDGTTWVLSESAEGLKMQDGLRVKCGERRLTYCSPRSAQGWDK